MRLLLISATGVPSFEHCKQEIADFLKPGKTVGFVTAANLFNEPEYFRTIEERLTKTLGVVRRLVHVRWESDGAETINRVDALLVGGGNTYALIERLGASGLLDSIREKVQRGLPYIGSSAGSNLAGPNILTTNDWNVVATTRFESLALVPFNLNPHYVERGTTDAPNSESRGMRIREYHQVWTNPVVAIPESSVLRIEDGHATVLGEGGAKVFEPGDIERWCRAGENLTFGGSKPLSAAR